MAIMSILISVIIPDDGGVTMQRIGLETFAQSYSEQLALVFLSSFDFFNIFVQKWCVLYPCKERVWKGLCKAEPACGSGKRSWGLGQTRSG